MIYHFEHSDQITVESKLSLIVEDIFELIYRHPYSFGQAREFHGIDHVCRSAILGGAIYNVLTTLKLEDTENLTQAQMMHEFRCVQIALLLHDSGRDGDGIDRWDVDSGINIYHYLTQRLGYSDQSFALSIAEAMINKDWVPGSRYHSITIVDGTIEIIESIRSEPKDLNLERLRLSIQFGDCVDIMRGLIFTMKKFDIRHLFLYQKYIDNQEFKEKIYVFMRESRRLIARAMQGDQPGGKSHGNANALDVLFSDMMSQSPEGTDILAQELAFYNGIIAAPMISHTMQHRHPDPIIAAFHRNKDENRLFYRAVRRATKLVHPAKKKHPNETELMLEFRKVFRNGENGKYGNPHRSVTYIHANGCNVIIPVGYGVILDDRRKLKIESVHLEDIRSGHGKKRRLPSPQDPEEIEIQLQKIEENFKNGSYISNEWCNEILASVHGLDCIMYTKDHTEGRLYREAGDEHLIVLEALYIRDYHYQLTKTQLPIYEFSGFQGYCVKKEFSENDIIETYDIVLKLIETIILTPSFHTIKSKLQELSRYYSPELKTIVDLRIQKFLNQFDDKEIAFQIFKNTYPGGLAEIAKSSWRSLEFLNNIFPDECLIKIKNMNNRKFDISSFPVHSFLLPLDVNQQEYFFDLIFFENNPQMKIIEYDKVFRSLKSNVLKDRLLDIMGQKSAEYITQNEGRAETWLFTLNWIFAELNMNSRLKLLTNIDNDLPTFFPLNQEKSPIASYSSFLKKYEFPPSQAQQIMSKKTLDYFISTSPDPDKLKGIVAVKRPFRFTQSSNTQTPAEDNASQVVRCAFM